MFAIVDCNNFYASCERVFVPRLRGKPIVVLSNNDGCIIARSNEAKALGYKMGDVYFQVKERLRKDGVFVFSSNYALYGDMSRRVMQTLEAFAPEMEIYSIDEAFLDLTGFRDLLAHGQRLRATVRQHTGIPVGVGIAPTKTLAKVANFTAKKQPQYNGVCVLESPTHWEPILAALPVGEVWGIGRQHEKRLHAQGVTTAFEFSQLSDTWLRKNMSVVGLRTAQELRGIPCNELKPEADARKSVTVSRSFGQRITELQGLEEALATYVMRAGEKLREQKLVAKHMLVFANTNPHAIDRVKDPYYAPQLAFELPRHTSFTPELLHYASHALRAMFKPGFRYMKCGVILTDIVPEGFETRDLFQTRDTAKDARLMRALDALNAKQGRGTVFFASAGIERPWNMSAALRSPAYTTDWAAIPTINA